MATHADSTRLKRPALWGTAVKVRVLRTNLCVLLISLLVALAILELLVRQLTPVPPPWREPQVFARNSPTLKWELRPNQRAFTIDAPVVTNSEGFRGPEFQVAKGPNTFRIVVLGDSVTFGVGARFEETYGQQLRRMLAAQYPDRKIEVLNMAVAGYNTRQELIVLREKALTYVPDLVVLGFYWNDVLGNDRPLPWERGFVPEPPAVAEDGHVIWAPRHSIPKPLRDLLREWRTLYLGIQRLQALQDSVFPSTQPYDVYFRALLAGNEQQFEESWRHTERRLKEFADLANEHRFRLLLLVFPDAIQMQDRYADIPYQWKLAEIADRLRIPQIDLRPHFKRTGWPYVAYDHVHPNDVGHQAAAAAAFDFIVTAKWIH